MLNLIFVGTPSEAKLFKSIIEDTFDSMSVTCGTPRLAKNLRTELETEKFGQAEPVEMLIHFAVSVAAHLTVEMVKEKFKEFKGRHPTATLKDKKDSNDETE